MGLAGCLLLNEFHQILEDNKRTKLFTEIMEVIFTILMKTFVIRIDRDEPLFNPYPEFDITEINCINENTISAIEDSFGMDRGILKVL